MKELFKVFTCNIHAVTTNILSNITDSIIPFDPPPSKHSIRIPQSILGISLKINYYVGDN